MLYITTTYEIWSQEDIPLGEPGERGFIEEDEPVTFRDLIERMSEFPDSSCYPATGSIHEWLDNHGDSDRYSGETENRSMHFSRKNPERKSKYWKLAMKNAGILKERK